MADVRVKSKKSIFALASIILVVCLCLSVYFSLGLGGIQAQESTDVQATPSPSPIPLVDETENSTLITEEEALALAMPLIEQYAQDNNRSISGVKAIFKQNVADLEGIRTGSAWFVGAYFDQVSLTMDNGKGNPGYWIHGYSVCIWADTSQIYDSHVMCVI